MPALRFQEILPAMWFRNLLVYRLNADFRFDAEALETALASKPARSCASQELSTYGFIAPFGKGADAPMMHTSQGFYLLAARKEERILPGSVVRDALKERVEQIEAEQMRKVYKKERDQLKDEIILDFLPRAFIRKSATFAAIAPEQGLILVDASSPKRAEDLLSTLREVLGSLPVRPLNVKLAPTATFTEWVKNNAASHGLHVLDECELRDTQEDGGIIRCKRQDLASEEIQHHLTAGKLVTKLSLAWEDKLSFVLDDKLAIKRLRFEDLLQDQAEQDGGDDALGQLDASFTLMMLTFIEFLPQLFDALGGEEIPQAI
jgi:recombination associated protein RdgC